MGKELYAAVYKGTIITSFISFVIGMTTSGITSLSSFQIGYSFLLISVLLILVSIISNIQSKGNLSMLNIIMNLLPFIVIMAVVGSLLYFSIKYHQIITDGHVSSGFSVFNNITNILLIIQLCILYSAISSDTFEEKGISNVTSSGVLLISVLSGISANIVRTILKYFTTDGFNVLRM